MILCLHGAPGGQSGHHACGFEDDAWMPELWDVVENYFPYPNPNPSPSQVENYFPNPNPNP